MRREFAEGLTARVAALRGALERLSQDATPDALHAFHLPAHALQGTAASFGADELAAPAAELAALGRRWREGGARPSELEAAAAALRRLAAAAERYQGRVAAS